MMLIVTPLKWHRRIEAYDLNGHDPYAAFQRVNELFEKNGERKNVHITLAHIGRDQLTDWVGNNVRPTWWEWLTGRIRVEYWSV